MEIGRYTVEAEVGRGSMGVVYLATDPRLHRQVAIKTFRVPDGLTADQKREFHERFLREAQAAARLSHPGIVTVYDSAEDEASGDPYIAMEYIEGRTLRERLDEEGCPTPERAFEIATILAEALHSAHESDIVHRDMKPGNVLVRQSDGQIKIADFGVARLPQSELTRAGTTVGSPAYMSPEHIRDGHVDARSDLFAVAVILYEMLCGERPFQGEELAALAYAIAHETPVPVTQRVAGLPPAIDGFFERALAKDREARFADGREFAAALRAAQNSPVDAGSPATALAALDSDDPTTRSQGIALPGDEDGAPNPGIYPADAERGGHDRADSGRGRRRWIAVAVAVLILLFGIRWLWSGGTSLELHGKSSVREGTLTLTVDGREVYTRELAAAGSKGAHMLRKAVGIEEESFDTTIAVTPGKHEIVAHLESVDGREHSEKLVIEVARGENHRLLLAAGRAYGAPLSMKSD